MTTTVLQEFTCRLSKVRFYKGDAYEGTPGRLAELAARGLVTEKVTPAAISKKEVKPASKKAK